MDTNGQNKNETSEEQDTTLVNDIDDIFDDDFIDFTEAEWEELLKEIELEEEDKNIDASEDLFNEAKKSYNKIDDKLFNFIGNFVVNQNNAAVQKKRLKNIFFWFTMIAFSIIIMTPIICLVVLMRANIEEYYIVFGAITASLLEVLTTVIVLPKIVAEYLFNKEEENANIKIVELMQKYSDTLHGYDNKE